MATTMPGARGKDAWRNFCILELCLIRVQGRSTSHKSDSNPGNFLLKYFCVTCQVPDFQTCPNVLLDVVGNEPCKFTAKRFT